MTLLRGHQKRWLILFALGAAVLAEGLFRSGALNPVDQRLQDAWFQWQGQRAMAQHVVIIAIDEETLAAYPDDPMVFWTDRLATVVGRLRAAGASVVGLDMLLSISPERWLGKLGGELQNAARDYDRPFREEVNSGRLVLVATRSGPGARESDYLLPSPDYLLALPDFDIPGYIGLGDLLDEGDGVIRRYLVEPVRAAGVAPPARDVPVLGFPSLLAVRAAGLDVHAQQWALGGRKVSRGDTATPIPYLGPPGTFPRISLKQLLADEPLPEAVAASLRGKAVILGATAAGLNDEHFTPYATRFFSGRGALMTGVEVHANIAESLLSGERLRPMGDGLRAATLLLLAGLAAALFISLPAWQGGLLWLASAPLLALASFAAFRAGVLAPVAAYTVAAGLVLLGCWAGG
ncbi:MAG: CHASE2 domain-containing protein [Rhodocyclales bacterium]|nr:CHASE2 domain-containing protein [Rhodocyclales bacterium]